MYDISGKKSGRNACYYGIMSLLIIIAGLRWRLGIDTVSYLRVFYYYTPKIYNLEFDELLWGDKPLWRILNSLVYTFGGRFYYVQLIHAALVNFLLFKYIKKHCNYIFTCVFFYCFWFYFVYNMETLKASLCIVFCLYANDYIIEKKWIKGYALYFVAFLFHSQAVLLLVTPLFLSIRSSKFSLATLTFVSFFFGFTMETMIGDYLNFVEEFGDESIIDRAATYAESNMYIGQENSILRKITGLYAVIFYIISSIIYNKLNNVSQEYKKIEPFVLIGFFCLMVQVNVHIFSRYASMYYVYFILLFTYVIEAIVRKKKGISRRRNAFIKALLLFVPFFVCIHTARWSKMYRFYPYYSIIEMKTDDTRERLYYQIRGSIADTNMY